MKRINKYISISILLASVFYMVVYAEPDVVNKGNNPETNNGYHDYKKAMTTTLKGKKAVTPKKELVYGLSFFDGIQYQGGFCPEAIDTIYMIAEVNNVITAHKTDVYFWPLTKEYIADWEEVNEEQEGVMVISKNNRTLKELSLKKYLLYYPRGYPGKSFILTEEAAEKRLEIYHNQIADFYNRLIDYYQAYGEYQRKNKEGTGLDLKDIPLEKPKPPQDYATPINRGFILNLPPGVYTIHLKDNKGNTVPKSVKKLVSFTKTGQGTGFEIIPEDKWTHPTKSDGLDGNIFAQRNQVIFLKPFKADQYQSYSYAKLLNLSKPSSGRGLENEKTWVHTLPLLGKENVIEIIKNNQVVRRIPEKQYIVRQQPGYALGYKIIEFNNRKFPDETPTFSAYKIEMPEDFHRYHIRLVNQNRKVVDRSVRNLSIVREVQFFTLLIIAVIPLICGVVVLVMRSVLVKKHIKESDLNGWSNFTH